MPQQEAALTPATLKLIREAAVDQSAWVIAHHLGWTISRLRSAASRFNIELYGDDEPPPTIVMPVERPRAAPGVPGRPVITPPIGYERDPRGKKGPRLNSSMTAEDIAGALCGRQWQIFQSLIPTLSDPALVPGKKIFSTLGITRNALAQSIHLLRRHLRITRYDIESSCMLRKSGYRLVIRA